MVTEIELLTQRLRLLEDLEEIRQLKYNYCDYADGGWEPRGGAYLGPVAELFTEDGVWDARPFMPIVRGREEIRRQFELFRKIPFAYHPAVCPRIKVTGDRATARWKIIGAGEMPDGHSGAIFLGEYEDEYVRTAEGWRIKSMISINARVGRLSGGWKRIGVDTEPSGFNSENTGMS